MDKKALKQTTEASTAVEAASVRIRLLCADGGLCQISPAEGAETLALDLDLIAAMWTKHNDLLFFRKIDFWFFRSGFSGTAHFKALSYYTIEDCVLPPNDGKFFP